MSDRLIFTIKHDGKVLAYLYQNWGAGDGEYLAEKVNKAARAYNLDLTRQKDAIAAIRIAGEEQYGHALWNGCEDMSDDEEWLDATKADRDYLETHRDEIVADNQDGSGFSFFYGVSPAYVDYIDGWCEDSYSMMV